MSARRRSNESERKYAPSTPPTMCASAASATSRGAPVSAHQSRKAKRNPWTVAPSASLRWRRIFVASCWRAPARADDPETQARHGHRGRAPVPGQPSPRETREPDGTLPSSSDCPGMRHSRASASISLQQRPAGFSRPCRRQNQKPEAETGRKARSGRFHSRQGLPYSSAGRGCLSNRDANPLTQGLLFVMMS